MDKSITPLKAFTHLICTVCLVAIVAVQYTVIQSNRGSAMGISYFFVLIPWVLLILLILFLLDRKHSNNFSRIFAVLTQSSFLPYFIYKVIFYHRAMTDYQFYKDHLDDHFPPDNVDTCFAFLLSVLIILYSSLKMTKRILGKAEVAPNLKA
jgi:hypothetical protein